MNYSGVMDVNLVYKIYKILVQSGHLELLKYFFLAILMIID